MREVARSHVNCVVADTRTWEQSAAYSVDTHPVVAALVKNAGLGFSIAYLHNGQSHEFVPDFLSRLAGAQRRFLILETKGFDEPEEIKRAAALRWVNAVNAGNSFGTWDFALAKSIPEVRRALDAAGSRSSVAPASAGQEARIRLFLRCSPACSAATRNPAYTCRRSTPFGSRRALSGHRGIARMRAIRSGMVITVHAPPLDAIGFGASRNAHAILASLDRF
ncbi:MAG: hypothetical protein IT514_09845 [Burkholderiales bacterium]|nr:hypothetical protein [Burkholderiales bacterium]